MIKQILTILLIGSLISGGIYIWEHDLIHKWFGSESSYSDDAPLDVVSEEFEEISESIHEDPIIEESVSKIEESSEITQPVENQPIGNQLSVSRSDALNNLLSAKARDEQRYNHYKSEIKNQIENLTRQINQIYSERPNFQSGRIRTSDADRNKWRDQRNARIKQLEYARSQAKERMNTLESTWRGIQSDYRRKEKELK